VGTHTLTATATDKAGNEATATRNYTVVKADQAPLTVTSPNSGTYGEHLTIDTSGGTTNGAVSFQATGACQIDNDNKLEITDGTGTCSVTATMAGNANYNDVSSDPPHSVTVNKRSVTVTADAKSKTYGDDDPALTYKLTNGSLVNSDGFSGDLSRATGETVAGSPYAIQQGTLSLPASKYILNYEGANFTINARPITVTPDSGQSKVYGENDPTRLTYKLASGSTLAPGDTLADVTTGALTRASGENVGTYAIQQGSLAAANNNYNLSFVGSGVTFEITKAPITIKANDTSRYYGEPDPTFGYTIVSGSFKNGDLGNGVSVDLSTTATATSQAGSYDINVELSGPKAGNYNLTAQKGTLTIKAWTNKGFFSPVDYGTTQNTVKGGSTVPLKFQVFQGTQQITNTAYVSGLKPVVTSCATGAPIDSIEELATGGTNLRYDTTGGQFIFNWQTPKKPGTCYNVTVQMVDGTQIPVAKFWLK
jgi:hypothetical protein